MRDDKLVPGVPDDMDDLISKREFVDILCASNICGRFITNEEAALSGVTESIDAIGEDDPIDRRSAARILHMYMKNICGIKDLPDISAAGCLMDLYDCRICVNHIAQVYLRGLMKASDCDDVCIFDGLRPIGRNDVVYAVNALDDIVNKRIS